ncbi:cytochrome P450 [Luteolibacter sp. AS25]|uniref:cytochrome P450 n=1 Tax=Luteolibacter sp. AS25 TaxID=3135776 RepID=UPI00398A686A
MAYTPPYPKPLEKGAKRSLWNLFKRGRRSWLATLYEGSYSGHMSRVRLPGVQLFLVKIPELIKEVLVDKYAVFPKHELSTRVLKPLLGESIFTTNGEVWERQRRMLDPAFGQAKLKDVYALMKGGSDAMIERLDKVEDGAEVDIEMEMTHVTADIILRTILSETLEGDTAKKIFDNFHLFQEKASVMIQMDFFHIPLWLMPHHFFVWKKTGRVIRELLAVPIRKRFEAYQRGEKGEYKDILQSLLETRDPVDGSKYTVDELIDQVAMLFLAGHETSASALSWSLFLLTKCPEIQEKLHEETVRLLGEREPEFKDIPRHKQIRNVFRETMRLYPPVGFLIFRKAVGDQVIKKGKKENLIPDGSPVAVAPWLVHRHRELWENPDEFNPDRFEGGLDKPSCAYIPFGQGPRICIGAAFAMQEAMLILASLTRRYRFEPGPGADPEPISRLTIRSVDGISLRLFRREETKEPGTPYEEMPETPPAGGGEAAKCPFH